MIRVLFESLGFLLPTLFVVTGLHVRRDPSAGEWLDGIASSLWFGLLYAAGAWLIAATRRRAAAPPLHPLAALGIGAGAGIATWIAVWALWAFPLADAPLRVSALGVNSAAMFAAAGATALVVHRVARR